MRDNRLCNRLYKETQVAHKSGELYMEGKNTLLKAGILCLLLNGNGNSMCLYCN